MQQHVLRFWETKFSQIRPLKRGGGRRYYRPEDVDLLRRIRETREWQQFMAAGAFNPTFMTGAEFRAWLKTTEDDHRALIEEAGFHAE